MDEAQRRPITVDSDDNVLSEDSVSYPATNVIRGMIREILTLPDYTLTRIAAEIGLSSATLRRLLQGNTLQPSVRTFDKVVRLYCSVCVRIYEKY